MSKPEASISHEESPASQLGISTVTPRILDRMIEVMASQGIALAAIGQSGIGKTAIPKQVARRRGVPYAAIHMPTATPEDWHLPTLPKDGSAYYDKKIPRTFQKLLEYVEKVKAENDGVVPPDRRPILALEELNRATDKAVTRGAFVLMGDRMIGDVHLDDSIQIVASMNPSGAGFSVNEFEKDPAMRRRAMLVYLAADYADFMSYAEAAKFHPEVVGYLRAHANHFYDETAAKAGRVFACPATWEAVSEACFAMHAKSESLSDPVARAAFSGVIGTAMTETFVEYVRDRTTTVAPDDILYRYGAGFDTRGRVTKLLSEGRLDRLGSMVDGLVVRVVTLPVAEQLPEKFAANLAAFLVDIPPEIALTFMSKGTDLSKRIDQEHYNWFIHKLNPVLCKKPEYQKMISAFHAAERKATAEAKAAGIK